MHPQSIFAIRHWNLPEILFVGAACFAMGAVGFFVAVFLQLNSTRGGNATQGYASSLLVPMEDKERVAQAVAASSPQPTLPEDTRNQSDPADPLAEQKIQQLKSLSAQ